MNGTLESDLEVPKQINNIGKNGNSDLINGKKELEVNGTEVQNGNTKKIVMKMCDVCQRKREGDTFLNTFYSFHIIKCIFSRIFFF